MKTDVYFLANSNNQPRDFLPDHIREAYTQADVVDIDY